MKDLEPGDIFSLCSGRLIESYGITFSHGRRKRLVSRRRKGIYAHMQRRPQSIRRAKRGEKRECREQSRIGWTKQMNGGMMKAFLFLFQRVTVHVRGV